MFLNLSNHSSQNWSTAQLRASSRWGEIQDMTFPPVPPDADEQALQTLAVTVFQNAYELKPECVLCQGEYTLCFALVRLFQKAGIECVAACSERICVENTLPDGSTQKNSCFRFVRYRRYGI